MYNCYCKNCNNLVGQWNNKYTYYSVIYCNYIQSKNFNSIYFLDCKHCDKFVGILCYDVCTNCFGKDIIFGEKNLFDWFLKYKKLQLKYVNYKFVCKICNKNNFRFQRWFFEELTFYK